MGLGRPRVKIINGTKACTKCKEFKPLSEFYTSAGKPSGYHSWCIPCERENSRQYFKTEHAKQVAKKWRLSEKGRISSRASQLRANEQRKLKNKQFPDRFRSYDLKKRIGITLAQKNDKLESQGSRCAICGTDTPNTKKIWFADHCHKTKKFRGVLCGRCNSVLGYALDSPAILVRAAVYLLNNSQLRDELVERKNDEFKSDKTDEFAPVSEFD